MLVWRITRSMHAKAPLDGEGSRLHGNRWNHPGIPIAYTSESLSLAALEYLVHLDPADMPDDLMSVQVIIPDHLDREIIDVAGLPPYWRGYPAPDELADIGDQWQREKRTPLLVVPSAVIPHEKNILINPHHSSFEAIAVAEILPFQFDDRLITIANKPATSARPRRRH